MVVSDHYILFVNIKKLCRQLFFFLIKDYPKGKGDRKRRSHEVQRNHAFLLG